MAKAPATAKALPLPPLPPRADLLHPSLNLSSSLGTVPGLVSFKGGHDQPFAPIRLGISPSPHPRPAPHRPPPARTPPDRFSPRPNAHPRRPYFRPILHQQLSRPRQR